MPIPDVLWKRYGMRESELTGIPSLKIAFNNVFGYYIEVRNTHKDKVPETWIRKADSGERGAVHYAGTERI